MGLFSFLFSSKSTTATPNDLIKDTHKNNTYLLKNNKILTVNDTSDGDDGDDDFINVNIRSLSYAEAAALKKIEQKSSARDSSAKNAATSAKNVSSGAAETIAAAVSEKQVSPSCAEDSSVPIVDISNDLGKDITDYQLAEIIQTQILSNKNDQIEQFAEDFEKTSSISKQSKLNKKYKKKKKNTKKSRWGM